MMILNIDCYDYPLISSLVQEVVKNVDHSLVASSSVKDIHFTVLRGREKPENIHT